MKKFKFCILAGLLTLLSVSAFAEGRLPANIQTAFQTLYPQATDVEWEQMAGCYVAEFIADGQEIDVWFNKQAEWVMTETDVESLEKVPAPVAEAFMSSTMTGMRLRDIRIITFPKHPTVIIIEVEQYNSDEEFQLFYAPDGKLLQSLDVTELGGEIYPGLFFNHSSLIINIPLPYQQYASLCRAACQDHCQEVHNTALHPYGGLRG